MNIKTHHTALLAACMLGASTMVWAQDNYDPYEPYNRFMFGINDGIDRTVLVPVARGYQKITPKPVRAGVTNVFDNLRDVVSFGSNVLRLDAEKASTDLVRVGINTTFGLGGLINIADAAQMPNNKNSLGDTFATWGWKNSNYFVYPLTGPSTVRDAVADTALRAYSIEGVLVDSEGWEYALAALKGVDKRAQMLVYTDGLDMAAVDRYAYMRDMFMHMRAKQVGGTYSGTVTEDIDIDDLVPSESNTSSELQVLDFEPLAHVDVAPVDAVPLALDVTDEMFQSDDLLALVPDRVEQTEQMAELPVPAVPLNVADVAI